MHIYYIELMIQHHRHNLHVFIVLLRLINKPIYKLNWPSGKSLILLSVLILDPYFTIPDIQVLGYYERLVLLTLLLIIYKNKTMYFEPAGAKSSETSNIVFSFLILKEMLSFQKDTKVNYLLTLTSMTK